MSVKSPILTVPCYINLKKICKYSIRFELRLLVHVNIFQWNIYKLFRVTGPLCGEFTGDRWIPRTKASDAELWCFLWSAPRINDWVNNPEAGDLRRQRAHYDVIVMNVMAWSVFHRSYKISYWIPTFLNLPRLNLYCSDIVNIPLVNSYRNNGPSTCL